MQWIDPHGRKRFWESAERTTRSSSGVDGVAVIARVTSRDPPGIVIISQFRPPVNCYCLELPAGLIDEGESAGAAALRELLEETGFTGRLLSVSPVCVSDPGMTNANMQLALVHVDLDDPENASVEQTLHDGEFISVELAPWDDLLSWCLEKKDRYGCEIDARLFSFAMGLHEERIAVLAEQGKGSPADPPPHPSSTEAAARPLGFGSPVFASGETAAPLGGTFESKNMEKGGWHAISGVVESHSYLFGVATGAAAALVVRLLRRS